MHFNKADAVVSTSELPEPVPVAHTGSSAIDKYSLRAGESAFSIASNCRSITSLV